MEPINNANDMITEKVFVTRSAGSTIAHDLDHPARSQTVTVMLNITC